VHREARLDADPLDQAQLVAEREAGTEAEAIPLR
jgi:hypothetical protein